jgi:hypothetical protein
MEVADLLAGLVVDSSARLAHQALGVACRFAEGIPCWRSLVVVEALLLDAYCTDDSRVNGKEEEAFLLLGVELTHHNLRKDGEEHYMDMVPSQHHYMENNPGVEEDSQDMGQDQEVDIHNSMQTKFGESQMHHS